MNPDRLTATLPEHDGAAEFVEPLSVERRPVNRHGVLRRTEAAVMELAEYKSTP